MMENFWLILSGLVICFGAALGRLFIDIGFSGIGWLATLLMCAMVMFYFAGYKDKEEEIECLQ